MTLTLEPCLDLFPVIGAGNKAARSAAFDLAFRYLKMADSLLPIEDPRNWQDREHLCIGIATLWSEVGRALHMAAEVIPKVRLWNRIINQGVHRFLDSHRC